MNDIYGNYSFDGLENWLWKFSKPSVPSYNINTDVRLSVYMYFKNSKGLMIPCPYLDLEKYARNWEFQKFGHIGIAPAKGIKGEDEEGKDNGPHELTNFCFDLTPFVQSVELPEVGTSAEAKAPTQFGEIQVGQFSPWSSDGSVSVTFQLIDTEFSILDAIFYPWLKDIGMSRWYDGLTAVENKTTPFPIATIEIRTPRRRYHPNVNDQKEFRMYSYKLIGARPTKFGNFEANMESRGSLLRSLTMGCDMVMIDFDKQGYDYNGKLYENPDEGSPVIDPNPNPNPPEPPNPEPMMAEERDQHNIDIFEAKTDKGFQVVLDENGEPKRNPDGTYVRDKSKPICKDMVDGFWSDKVKEGLAKQAREGKPLTKQQRAAIKKILRKDEDQKNPPPKHIFGDVPEGKDAQQHVKDVLNEKKKDVDEKRAALKDAQKKKKDADKKVKDLADAMANAKSPAEAAQLAGELSAAQDAAKDAADAAAVAGDDLNRSKVHYNNAVNAADSWNATNDAAAEARTNELNNAVNTAIDDKFGGGFAAAAQSSADAGEGRSPKAISESSYTLVNYNEGGNNEADLFQQSQLDLPGIDLTAVPYYNVAPQVASFDFTEVNSKPVSVLNAVNNEELEISINEVLEDILTALTSDENFTRVFKTVVSGFGNDQINSFEYLFNEEQKKIENLQAAEVVNQLEDLNEAVRDVNETEETEEEKAVSWLQKICPSVDWASTDWNESDAFKQWIIDLSDGTASISVNDEPADSSPFNDYWETEKLRIPKGIYDNFDALNKSYNNSWGDEIEYGKNNPQKASADSYKIGKSINDEFDYLKKLFSKRLDLSNVTKSVEKLNALIRKLDSSDHSFKSSNINYLIEDSVVTTSIKMDESNKPVEDSFLRDFADENKLINDEDAVWKNIGGFEFIQKFQTDLYFNNKVSLANIELTDVSHSAGYISNLQEGATDESDYWKAVFQNNGSLAMNNWNELPANEFRCYDVDFILPYGIESTLLDVCGLSSRNVIKEPIITWNKISEVIDGIYDIENYWKNPETRLALFDFEYEPYEMSNVDIDDENYFDYLYSPDSIIHESRNTTGLSKAEIVDAVAYDREFSKEVHKRNNAIYNIATWKIINDEGCFTGDRWLKAVVKTVDTSEPAYKIVICKIDQFGSIIRDNGIELDDDAMKLFEPADGYKENDRKGSIFISKGLWKTDHTGFIFDEETEPEKENPTEILYTLLDTTLPEDKLNLDVNKAKINLAGVIEDDFHPNYCYRILWDREINYDEDDKEVSVPHFPLILKDAQPAYISDEDKANELISIKATYLPENLTLSGSKLGSITYGDIFSNDAKFNMDLVCLENMMIQHNEFRNFPGGPYGTLNKGFVSKFYNYFENNQKPVSWVDDLERDYTNTKESADVFRQNIPEQIQYIRQIPQVEKRLRAMSTEIQDIEIRLHYQEDKLALYYKQFERVTVLKELYQQIKKLIEAINLKLESYELDLDTKCLSWVKIHEKFIDLIEEYNNLLDNRDETLTFQSNDISRHIENAQRFYQVETELRNMFKLYFDAREDFYISAVKYLVYRELQRQLDSIDIGKTIQEFINQQTAVFNYIMLLKESLNTINTEYTFRLDRYRMLNKKLVDFKGRITALRKESLYNQILYFDMLTTDPTFTGFPELIGHVIDGILYSEDSSQSDLDKIMDCGWDFTDADEYDDFGLFPPVSKADILTLPNSNLKYEGAIPTSYYYNGFPIQLDVYSSNEEKSESDIPEMNYEVDLTKPTYLEDLLISDEDDEETKIVKIKNQKLYFNNISMALRIKLQDQIKVYQDAIQRKKDAEEEAELYRNSLKYDTSYAFVGNDENKNTEDEEKTAESLKDFEKKVNKYVEIMKIRSTMFTRFKKIDDAAFILEQKLDWLKKDVNEKDLEKEIQNIKTKLKNGELNSIEKIRSALDLTVEISNEIKSRKLKNDALAKMKFSKLAKVLIKANEIKSEKEMTNYVYKKILPGFLEDKPELVNELESIEKNFNEARNRFVLQREKATDLENDVKAKKNELQNYDQQIKECENKIAKSNIKVVQLKSLRSKLDLVAKREILKKEIDSSIQTLRGGINNAKSVKDSFNEAQAKLIKKNKEIQTSMEFKQQFTQFISDMYDVVFE